MDVTNTFTLNKKWAFKTIPNEITDCILQQNAFHPNKIVDGLVVVLPNTGEELLKPEFWDLVILRNYVYSILYCKLNAVGDQTLFGGGDAILSQIGDKVAQKYGEQYRKLINSSVNTIDEYDSQ